MENLQLSNNGHRFKMDCCSKKEPRRLFVILKRITMTKKFCLVCSIVCIIIIWAIALTPLLISIPLTIVAAGSNVSSSTGVSTLGTRLPPINLTNSSVNYTINRVDCKKSFVYSSADNICYPPCNWNAQGKSLILAEHILFSAVSLIGIIINVGTFLGWLFTHFINIRNCTPMHEFQLPRASLFTVFICNTGLLTTYALVDLMGRNVIFCSLSPSGQLYLPAHLILSYDLPRSTKIAMNVLGVLNYFFFLSTLIWLKNAFINMALVIYFPFHINKVLRTRILVFTAQCIYAFGIPVMLLFFIIGSHPTSPFGTTYILHQILIVTDWAYIFLYKWPYFLIAGVISTIMVLILAKLRFVSIENKSLGKSIQVTEIEKRLFAYSFIFTLILAIIGSGLLGVYLASLYYFKNIEEYILCVTVNSPVYILPPGTNQTTNATIAYRDNSYGGLSECSLLLDSANQLIPPVYAFIFSLCTRLVWFLPFLILIPTCSCDCKRRKINK